MRKVLDTKYMELQMDWLQIEKGVKIIDESILPHHRGKSHLLLL